MAATYNYTWDQGEDLEISLVYKEGPAGSPTAVNLTNYQVRMDIRSVSVAGSRTWTFNSSDISGEPLADSVGVSDNEIVLGSDGSIKITVPRSLTLPGGSIYPLLENANSAMFVYDVFLRNGSNKQKKIMTGAITVNRSVTLWL